MAATVSISGNAALVAMPSATVASLLPQARESYAAEPVAPVSSRELQPSPMDRVTLLDKERNLVKDENKRVAKKEQKQHEEPRTVADILFAYNFRGDLRVKFMDSGSNLIYQTPALLFSKMADLMLQPNTSVNTSA